MITLFKIILKNFKLLTRSKSSAMIIIFGPLLMIFLVGLAFNNSNQYQVNIGVYSSQYTPLTDSIILGLQDKSFRVTRYVSSEECVDSIKLGVQHTCIQFSPGLSIGPGMDNEINFSVDYSKVNLVWMILDAISKEISSKSSSLTTDMTNTLIEKIETTKKEMASDSALIMKLTSSNKEIKDNADAALAGLKAMDIGVDSDEFYLEQITNISSTIDEYVGYMIIHTNTLLSDVRGEINSYKINASDKQPAFTAMDEAESKIFAVRDKVSGQTENLTSLTSRMERNILDLQSRLGSASSKKQDAIQKVEGIKSLSETELKHMLEMKNSFDRISSDISSIKVLDADDIASPIQTNIVPVTTQTTHLNNLFPSLLVLVIMFIGILLSSTLVIMEKRSKAYFRNFITPTNDVVFVLGTFLTSMIVVVFQIILLSVAAFFYFKIDLLSNFGMIALILLLASTVFILIGMAIGYVFSREEASTLASISVGSVFLFLSSVIIPIESMPDYIIRIVRFNPFVISESILSKSLFFSTGFAPLKTDFIILGIYTLALFSFILAMQYMIKKMYLTGMKHVVDKVRKK